MGAALLDEPRAESALREHRQDIERRHPDVVLLQEVWTKSAMAAAPADAHWSVAQAPSANFFRRNGLMVLSRLPIAGAEFRAFNKAAFPDALVRKGALKVTVQSAPGQRLNIWNVHLQNDAPEVRLSQIMQLAEWVRGAEDGQTADVVGGDFNSTPDSAEFQTLSRELGQTAHQIAHVAFSPTYDGLSTDPKMAQTIDYVFIRPRRPINIIEATPSLALTNANLGERLSDHVALEVALRFQAQKPPVARDLAAGLTQPAGLSSHEIEPTWDRPAVASSEPF